MKKSICWGLFFALGLSLLTGCGTDAPFDPAFEITVVSREEGSGTRGAFVELTGVEAENDAGDKVDNTTIEAVTVSSTSVVMTTVAGDPYAIGYISMGSLNSAVKALEIDGFAPTADNVKKGTYPISRPFILAMGKDVTPVTQDFLDFIDSRQGQAVIEKSGFIGAAENPQDFVSRGPSGKIVVAGSSSVTPVMEKLKEAYLLVNPAATMEVQMSDSSTGMASVASGICDIGMASRPLKDSELDKGLSPTVMAMDGIAVIVNHKNPLTNLPLEDLRAIYMGEALTWQQAGQHTQEA